MGKINNFYNSPLPEAPLLCWDIFMEGFQERMDLAEDTHALNKLSSHQKWQHDFDFFTHLFQMKETILVTDSTLHIVYASSSMYFMNGYTLTEVSGLKPNIFQGQGTSMETKLAFRSALSKQLPFEATILNYKKSGEPYDCHIKSLPLYNQSNTLVNFIAFENIP